MKDSNMNNENVRVATLKLTKYINVVVKEHDDYLYDTFGNNHYEDFVPSENMKRVFERYVGDNNVYINRSNEFVGIEVIHERQVDKEWLEKNSVNYIEEQLKDVVEESGWFDDAEKEAA